MHRARQSFPDRSLDVGVILLFSLHGDSHMPRVELNFASGLSRTFDLLPHLHGQFAVELRHFIGFFRLTLHGSLAQDAPGWCRWCLSLHGGLSLLIPWRTCSRLDGKEGIVWTLPSWASGVRSKNGSPTLAGHRHQTQRPLGFFGGGTREDGTKGKASIE